MTNPIARLLPLWALGLSLLIYGGVIAVKRIVAAIEGNESLSWPTTDGQITTSALGEGSVAGLRGSSHRVWSPNVSYRYRVGGQDYTGTRVDFSESPTKDQARMAATVKRFAVAAPVTVHYRAQDPNHSVLDAGASSVPWKRKVLGVCGVGAALILAAYLLAWRFGYNR